jgi:Glyoxalase/Bleomycin resistance protein/Dioxygenase superfamily
MINLVVDDVDEALCQVELAGGTLIGKPKAHPFGRFGWFLDPDGNKVELWQLPDGRARRSSRARTKPRRSEGLKATKPGLPREPRAGR